MSVALRLVGALVITYLLSRLTQVLTHTFLRGLLKGRLAIVFAHLASLAFIALIVGFMKAYWVTFLVSASYIYVGPQLIWMVIDLLRYKRG